MEQTEINNMVKKVINSLKKHHEKADLVFPHQIEPLVDQDAWSEVMKATNIADTSQITSDLHEMIKQFECFGTIITCAKQGDYIHEFSRMDCVDNELYWDPEYATLPLNHVNIIDRLNSYLRKHQEGSENDK